METSDSAPQAVTKMRSQNLLLLDTDNLPPKMDLAANLLGRCVDRKAIHAEVRVHRKTLWQWLQLPAFQAAVTRYNREWISELNERKARIIEQALLLEEQDLLDKASKTRMAKAHDIAKNVLG